MLSDFIFQKIVPKDTYYNKLNIKAFFQQDNQEIFFLCKTYPNHSEIYQIILLDMEMGK